MHLVKTITGIGGELRSIDSCERPLTRSFILPLLPPIDDSESRLGHTIVSYMVFGYREQQTIDNQGKVNVESVGVFTFYHSGKIAW